MQLQGRRIGRAQDVVVCLAKQYVAKQHVVCQCAKASDVCCHSVMVALGPSRCVAVIPKLHGMTPTPEKPTVPFHQNAPHEADPMDLFMPALQDAIEQLEVIHDAWCA